MGSKSGLGTVEKKNILHPAGIEPDSSVTKAVAWSLYRVSYPEYEKENRKFGSLSLSPGGYEAMSFGLTFCRNIMPPSSGWNTLQCLAKRWYLPTNLHDVK
jgi:hypothetical protein